MFVCTHCTVDFVWIYSYSCTGMLFYCLNTQRGIGKYFCVDEGEEVDGLGAFSASTTTEIRFSLGE